MLSGHAHNSNNPPSERIIHQLSRLFQQEWGQEDRWLDDLRFYLVEGEWKLQIYKGNKEQIIGAIIYKYLRKSNSVAIAYLIVDKNHRGRGIGNQLTRKIEKYARDIQASSIFFDSSEPIEGLKEHFFIRKLGYLIAEAPILLPDEPPATYLFMKPFSTYEQIGIDYFKKLVGEYITASYSSAEREKYRWIFKIMFSAIESLESVPLTKNPFLEKYRGTEYTKKQCRAFSEEELEKFAKDVMKSITSQSCGIK